MTTTDDPFANEREQQYWLDKIGPAMAGVGESKEALDDCVRRSKEAGASWGRVGRALGTTGKAAQQRYRHLSNAGKESR